MFLKNDDLWNCISTIDQNKFMICDFKKKKKEERNEWLQFG